MRVLVEARDFTKHPILDQLATKWDKAVEHQPYRKSSIYDVAWRWQRLLKDEYEDYSQIIYPYLKWYIRICLNAMMSHNFATIENAFNYTSVFDDIIIYDTLKRKKRLRPEHKDINRIKHLSKFRKIIYSYPSIEDGTEERMLDGKNANLYYEDNKARVIELKTKKACAVFGRGTQWCTAHGAAMQYLNKGPLYVIIDKKNPKQRYQISFEAFQLMDRDDNPMDVGVVKKYKLNKVFKDKWLGGDFSSIAINDDSTAIYFFDDFSKYLTKQGLYNFFKYYIDHNIEYSIRNFYPEARLTPTNIRKLYSYGITKGYDMSQVPFKYMTVNMAKRIIKKGMDKFISIDTDAEKLLKLFQKDKNELVKFITKEIIKKEKRVFVGKSWHAFLYNNILKKPNMLVLYVYNKKAFIFRMANEYSKYIRKIRD